MSRLLAATVVLAILPVAANALDTAECGAIEEQVSVLLDAEFGIEMSQSPTSVSGAEAAGCTVTDLDVYVQSLGVMYRIDRLSYTGTGLIEWVRGEVILPSTLDVTMDGVALNMDESVPQDLEWLVPLRAETLTVSSTWNETQQHLQIAPLQISMDDGSIVTLAIDGQANGWRAYATPFADFGVTEMRLGVSFNGLFEQAVAAPLTQEGIDMSPGSLAFIAAMADGLMANAPAGLLSARAPGAIGAFLRSLPTPRGDLQLTLTSDTPLSIERTLHDLRTGIPFDVAVPDGTNIDALWEPAAR